MTPKAFRFENGPRAGERVPLDKSKVTFGRKQSCDCVLTHATVSREHFFVELNDRKYFVVDCNSGNGTLVNGERVTWAELRHGDRVQAGPFSFVVELGNQLSAATGPTPADPPPQSGHGEDSQSLSSHRGRYPDEYLDGIEHFNAGRYYEAHEILEELWLRSSGDDKLFLQMLIQAAVALHHYTHGNLRGARNLYQAVMEKLTRLPETFLGADLSGFSASFRRSLASLVQENDDATVPPLDAKPRIDLLLSD